ncbi:MAG: hypothetical protein AAFX76_13870, partial [Planctomycetota bacterium]
QRRPGGAAVLTLAEVFEVLHEAHRVLRPGGAAVLTTEYALGDGGYLLPGVNAWDAEVLEGVRRSFGGFEWLGPCDLSFDTTHPANAPRVRRHLPAGRQQPHARRFAEAFRGGHVGVLLGVSVCVPIAFVLRKTEGRNLTWSEAEVGDELRAYTDGVGRFLADREAEALAVLEPLDGALAARPERRQMALHAGRYMIDAHARLGAQRQPKVFRQRIEAYLERCPTGELQDADCLDLCAYLLGEMGFHDASAEVSRRCLRSPSASADHVYDLAGRFLRYEKRAGRLRPAIDEVAGYLADLLWTGYPGDEVRRRVAEAIDPELGRRERARLRAAVGAAWREVASDLAGRWR